MADRPAILLTGGAGYIGSHGCRALVAAGSVPSHSDLATSIRTASAWYQKAHPLKTGGLSAAT